MLRLIPKRGERCTNFNAEGAHRTVELVKSRGVEQQLEHPVSFDQHDRSTVANCSLLAVVELIEVAQVNTYAEVDHQGIPFTLAANGRVRDVAESATHGAEHMTDDIAQLADEPAIGVVHTQNSIDHEYLSLVR